MGCFDFDVALASSKAWDEEAKNEHATRMESTIWKEGRLMIFCLGFLGSAGAVANIKIMMCFLFLFLTVTWIDADRDNCRSYS